MTVVMFLFPSLNVSKIQVDRSEWNTDYAYVYCHGLSGWGSYDLQYRFLPYWGMFGGDMIKNLNTCGYKCYAASVDPQGSAWDRACELYAQLTGTRVDYGREHSERCGHERFGKDFSGKRLVPGWSAEEKINLLGHSFGGVTVRLLAELMASGSKEERAVTGKNEISALFTGGKADWIYSVTTLAAPSNGTTAYGFGNPDEEVKNHDSAAYDMYIDNAMKINRNILTRSCTYYFAVPCSSTYKNEDGTYSADSTLTDLFMRSSANEMGSLTGVTPGGYAVDKTWLENDGLVNTVSAKAPSGAPSTALDRNNIRPGIWNVAPTYKGDHMALNGDLFSPNNIRPFYADWMNMINSI